jgi:hypothetical protein
MLRSAASKRIGATESLASHFAKLWTSAIIAGVIGFGVKLVVGVAHPKITAIVVLGFYGAAYFSFAMFSGVPEARTTMRRFKR